jgi:hypothetical protein
MYGPAKPFAPDGAVLVVVLILFVLDIIWSVMVPNTGEGITSGLV